jgi:hypothetical protein
LVCLFIEVFAGTHSSESYMGHSISGHADIPEGVIIVLTAYEPFEKLKRISAEGVTA